MLKQSLEQNLEKLFPSLIRDKIYLYLWSANQKKVNIEYRKKTEYHDDFSSVCLRWGPEYKYNWYNYRKMSYIKYDELTYRIKGRGTVWRIPFTYLSKKYIYTSKKRDSDGYK